MIFVVVKNGVPWRAFSTSKLALEVIEDEKSGDSDHIFYMKRMAVES